MELLKEYWELLVALVVVVGTYVRSETSQKFLSQRMDVVEENVQELQASHQEHREDAIRREQNQTTIIESLRDLKGSVKELLDRTARIEERENK